MKPAPGDARLRAVDDVRRRCEALERALASVLAKLPTCEDFVSGCTRPATCVEYGYDGRTSMHCGVHGRRRWTDHQALPWVDAVRRARRLLRGAR